MTRRRQTPKENETPSRSHWRSPGGRRTSTGRSPQRRQTDPIGSRS
jgi:hypothetical protein